jgi:hypothetical protein
MVAPNYRALNQYIKGSNCQSEEIALTMEPDKSLISLTHMKLKNLNAKRTNNPSNMWANE